MGRGGNNRNRSRGGRKQTGQRREDIPLEQGSAEDVLAGGPEVIENLTVDDKKFEDIIPDDFRKKDELIQGIYMTEKTQPSKIQAQVIPALTGFSGKPKSLLAQSGGGTGKTLAFNASMYICVDPELKELQAVCVCPTRELAIQARDEFVKITALCNDVTIGLAMKDEQPPPEGVQVLFGTAASINQYARNEADKKPNLTNLKMLIVDEADEVIRSDSVHAKAIRGIIRHIPESTILGFFSATFSPETKREIERCGHKDIIPITIPRYEQMENKRHIIMRCPNKQDEIDNILTTFVKKVPFQSLYVFVAKKDSTDHYVQLFSSLNVKTGALHSGLNFEQRDAVFAKFRAGEIQVLVTVTGFSRGIDVESSTHVINVDLPKPQFHRYYSRQLGKYVMRNFDDIDTYVHRACRAGRFGRMGIVLSLVKSNPDERLIQSIMRQHKMKFSAITLQDLNNLETAKGTEVVETEVKLDENDYNQIAEDAKQEATETAEAAETTEAAPAETTEAAPAESQ